MRKNGTILDQTYGSPNISEPPTAVVDPCNPSPCAMNAECRNNGGVASCHCPAPYEGDPYVICKVDCLQNADCALNLACFQNKCIDPVC